MASGDSFKDKPFLWIGIMFLKPVELGACGKFARKRN
jgi:hypothetical protein